MLDLTLTTDLSHQDHEHKIRKSNISESGPSRAADCILETDRPNENAYTAYKLHNYQFLHKKLLYFRQSLSNKEGVLWCGAHTPHIDTVGMNVDI